MTSFTRESEVLSDEVSIRVSLKPFADPEHDTIQ